MGACVHNVEDDCSMSRGSSTPQSKASSALVAIMVMLCLSGVLCSVPTTQYRSRLSGPSGSFPKNFIWAAGTAPHQAHAQVYRLYQSRFKPLQAGRVSLVLASPWMKPTRSNGLSGLKLPHRVTLDATLGWFAKPIFGDGFYPEALQSHAGKHLPRLLAAHRHIIHGSADFFALSFGPTSFRYLEPWQLLGQEYGSPPILLADCGWFVDAQVGTEDTTNLYMLKSFLYNSLQAVQLDGVNLIGVTVWPLLDGFDWSLGVQQGLFLLDSKQGDVTLKPKTSSLLYRDIVAQNGFGSAPPFHNGTFPCGFTWGAMDTAIQVEITSSYHGIYLWNVSGDGHLHSISSAHPRQSFHCSQAASVRHLVSALHWLGITHYRFTLDWGLLLPDADPSRPNTDALQFYHCFVRELRKAAIKPVATLHRPWDPSNGLPMKLQVAGGWKNPSIVSAFKSYANLCFKTFGYDIQSWVTLDEPNQPKCLWKNGVHKNGKMSADESMASEKDDIKHGDLNSITHNLFRAHVLTWQAYDNHYRAQQGGRVGLALLADWYKPANPYMLSDQEAATDALVQQLGPFADALFSVVPKFSFETTSSTSEQANSSVPLKTPSPYVQPASSANDTTFPLHYGACDFLGLNHFTTWLVGNNGWVFRDITIMRSPLDNSVEPQGLRQLLNWLRHRYGDSMALVVTANGIDDRSSRTDHLRVIYHKSYLNELLKAIQLDGANVQGYFSWVLRDRTVPDYGLFASSYYRGAAKSSAKLYRSIIRKNGFPSNASHITESCKVKKQNYKNTSLQNQSYYTCPFCQYIKVKGHIFFFCTCLIFSAVVFAVFIAIYLTHLIC
uniref:beta-klotho isoform X2 n=1 Tax=Myxine glutinosa TaxID=7769 RepID=UPI00358EC0EA